MIPNFQEQYETGLPTFLKLFNMPKEELLKTLKEICGNQVGEDVLEPNTRVRKEILDDEPEKITLWSWDKLEITPFGINYTREHGKTTKIVQFNKFFVL